MIVGQRWALAGLYTILDRRGSAVYLQLLEDGGRFALSKLSELAWNEAGYTTDQQRMLLSFMELCGLCFKLHRAEHAWREEDVFISQEHLPSAREARMQLDLDPWADEPPPRDELEVSLMHSHHWQLFLADAGARYGQEARYASDGFFLKNKHGQQLLVLIRLKDGGLGGDVRIQVSGPDAESRLAATKAHLLHFLPGEEQTAERTTAEQGLGEPAGRKQVFITYAWEPQQNDDRGIPAGY